MNIESAKTARSLGKLTPNPKAKLRDQFHEVARFKYLSERTETSYWQWVVRYLKFHRRPLIPALSPGGGEGVKQGGWQHPRELGARDIAAFLSDRR